MQLQYRPEIDGLRAIAVMSVVLYHAEFLIFGADPFKGGFIGVDIFFVISGYLITSIILRELKAGNFSFARFYERRARRILPALLTVILATIPFAWLYMLPKPLSEFAGSGLAAIAFSSNIWFWLEDSYTAAPSLLKPLLHTWSLSVEEQFYLIAPVALLLAWKYLRRHMMAVFALTALASLLLAQYGSSAFPDATFFLLPTRAWELIAGALLAKLEQDSGRQFGKGLEFTMPIFGLVLIISSVFFFDDQMQHPSIITLLPISGTMLIIWFCRNDGPISYALSSKPFVSVGLISYSLYLWHFPIFAFARIANESLSNADKWGLIFFAFVLSILSFLAIERPARQRQAVQLKPLLVSLAISIALGVSVFTFLFYTDGASQRLADLESVYKNAEFENIKMDGRRCDKLDFKNVCEKILPNSKYTLINIGDSHGYVLGAELDRWANKNGMSYVHMTRSRCPFILGAYHYVDGKLDDQCDAQFQKEWWQKIRSYPNRIIVYSGRFAYGLSGTGFDNTLGGIEDTSDWRLSASRETIDQEGAAQLISRTIRRMSRNAELVVLVYPVPEVSWNVPLRTKNMLDSFPANDRLAQFENIEITTPYSVFKDRTRQVYQSFDDVRSPNILRVYPADIFCDPQAGVCRTKNESELFYSDDDHVSKIGAQMVVQKIADQLATQIDSVALK